MSDFETITTEIRGHVYLMGLNRPKKMNSFTSPARYLVHVTISACGRRQARRW